MPRPAPTGRPRRYCSSRCKKRAWRHRDRESLTIEELFEHLGGLDPLAGLR
jgi:hypothetical protein